MLVSLILFKLVLDTLDGARKQTKEEKGIRVGKVGNKLSLFSENNTVK